MYPYFIFKIYIYIYTKYKIYLSGLNTKYIWAMLIKLHDSATYNDRRKSYEWVKHQAFKCNFISLKVYFFKSADQKQ